MSLHEKRKQAGLICEAEGKRNNDWVGAATMERRAVPGCTAFFIDRGREIYTEISIAVWGEYIKMFLFWYKTTTAIRPGPKWSIQKIK